MYGRCHKVTALRDGWQMIKKAAREQGEMNICLLVEMKRSKGYSRRGGQRKKTRGKPGQMMKYIFFKWARSSAICKKSSGWWVFQLCSVRPWWGVNQPVVTGLVQVMNWPSSAGRWTITPGSHSLAPTWSCWYACSLKETPKILCTPPWEKPAHLWL